MSAKIHSSLTDEMRKSPLNNAWSPYRKDSRLLWGTKPDTSKPSHQRGGCSLERRKKDDRGKDMLAEPHDLDI